MVHIPKRKYSLFFLARLSRISPSKKVDRVDIQPSRGPRVPYFWDVTSHAMIRPWERELIFLTWCFFPYESSWKCFRLGIYEIHLTKNLLRERSSPICSYEIFYSWVKKKKKRKSLSEPCQKLKIEKNTGSLPMCLIWLCWTNDQIEMRITYRICSTSLFLQLISHSWKITKFTCRKEGTYLYWPQHPQVR